MTPEIVKQGLKSYLNGYELDESIVEHLRQLPNPAIQIAQKIKGITNNRFPYCLSVAETIVAEYF